MLNLVFCFLVLGADSSLAKSLLSVCNGNLEMAINMQMEGVQGGEGSSSNGRAGPSNAREENIYM